MQLIPLGPSKQGALGPLLEKSQTTAPGLMARESPRDPWAALAQEMTVACWGEGALRDTLVLKLLDSGNLFPPSVPREHDLPNAVKVPSLPPRLLLQSDPESPGPRQRGAERQRSQGRGALNPIPAACPHDPPASFPGFLQGSEEIILTMGRPSSGMRATVTAVYTQDSPFMGYWRPS